MSRSENAMVKRLLSLLIEKYEQSKSYKDQAAGPRRVALTPKGVRGLNLEDFEQKEAFIGALNVLKAEGLVDFEWQPFETGNLVKRFWLILDADSLEKAYGLVGRPVTYAVKSQVMAALGACVFGHYEWMARFQQEVLMRFERTGKYGSLLLPDDEASLGLIKLLNTLDQRLGQPIHERLLSLMVFGDTKVFQKEYKAKLKLLVTRYGTSDTLDDIEGTKGPEDTNDNEHTIVIEDLDEVAFGTGEGSLLESYLGIYSNPETLQFSGKLVLHMEAGQLDTSVLPSGVSLLGRSVPTIQSVSGAIDQVLFVENQACYEMAISGEYAFLKPYLTDKTLIVYQGGFTSRMQGLLYTKLYSAFPCAQYWLWSDIDLGGARIFAQLQQLVPPLKSVFMDKTVLKRYEKYCVPFSADYATRVSRSLTRALEDPRSNPEYIELLRVLNGRQARLEQEILGLDYEEV